MAKVENLETLKLDVTHGILEINGVDMAQGGRYLKLEFENDAWSLFVTEDSLYTTNKPMFAE